MLALVKAASEAFADGRNPFEAHWLSEHNVTFEECGALSKSIATILAGYVKAGEETKSIIILMGIADEAGLPTDIIESAGMHMRARRRLDRIFDGS